MKFFLWNFYWSFEIYKKNLSVLNKRTTFIALIFWKLLSWKNVVTSIPERCWFRTPIGSQRVKWPERILKCARHQFYANFPLISNSLSCVSWLLVGSETLGQFSKMLTADHKYSCHNWGKFLQQLQPELSSKAETFFGSFIAFLKFR